MNLSILHKQLGTQDKCIAYLEKLRWNKKPKCVFCDSDNVTKRKNSMRWHCNNCSKDYSVLVGTIFEGTRLELFKFFEIMFLMINAKMGISASEIARNTGVKYQTAWFACHKIRCAMIGNELRLEGLVEFATHVKDHCGRSPSGASQAGAESGAGSQNSKTQSCSRHHRPSEERNPPRITR